MFITSLINLLCPSLLSQSKQPEKITNAIDSAESIAYLVMIFNFFKHTTFSTTPRTIWPTIGCYAQPPVCYTQIPPVCYLPLIGNTGMNLTAQQINAREGLSFLYKGFINRL